MRKKSSEKATNQTSNTSREEMGLVQRAALDRVYGWLFAPLPDEQEDGACCSIPESREIDHTQHIT